MKLSFLFMGTGSSMGVPVVGCGCSVCHSKEIYNHRLRPGYVLEYGGKRLLIDASQDFREQALKYQLTHVDGVFITHSHHDHTAGIDDLRALNTDKPLPLLMSKECYADLAKRYGYIFEPVRQTLSAVTKSQVSHVEEGGGPIEFAGMPLYTFPFYQMGMRVDGVRVGNFAFLSDIKEYEESLFTHLQGVEVLVISALREQTSPIHFNVEESIAFSKKVKAKRTYFVHIAHEIDHEELQRRLPPQFILAYDGLRIEVEI